MGSTRQGFYWWEIDITYYILKAMSWVGLIWDLRPVPETILAEGRRKGPATATSDSTADLRDALDAALPDQV